jgi:deoxycytidylate deaminase
MLYMRNHVADVFIHAAFVQMKRRELEVLAQNFSHAFFPMTQMHVAFLFRRGHCLASATNWPGSRKPGYSMNSVHAERNLLMSVDRRDLFDSTVELMGSKPCHGCQQHLRKAISKYGLRRVEYS